MNRNRLYAVLGLACIAAYGLIFYSANLPATDFTTCFFKNVTGVACPSCGTTRALRLIGEGELWRSVLINPIGILAAVLLLVIPLWIIFDVITKSSSLYAFYKKSEETIRIKYVAALLIILVVANWIWNIQKNL